MAVIDKDYSVDLCLQAWNRAWSKGYVYDSVADHAGADFLAIAKGAIVGAAGGLALVFVAETGGAVAAGGLAAYFTAGNPAAVAIAAEAGFTIGQTVAEGCLAIMGVLFLYEYVKDHVTLLYPNITCAYDLMVNQAPYFVGDMQALMVDMAAREIAEAIGIFCGLLLAALALYVIHRITSAKTPGQPNLMELMNSKIERLSQGLTTWILRQLPSLRQRRLGPPVLRLIEGGLPSSTVSTIAAASQSVRQILPSLVGTVTRSMSSRDLVELDGTLTRGGFDLIADQEYGPAGGYQLFWRRGNVLVRFKTLGDERGPRANTPHLSIGLNDGRGLDWCNDMAKFTATGKIVTKVITSAENFRPTDFQGNAQRFVLIPNRFEISEVDAWAQQTHFNADPGFSLRRLDAIRARSPRHLPR